MILYIAIEKNTPEFNVFHLIITFSVTYNIHLYFIAQEAINFIVRYYKKQHAFLSHNFKVLLRIMIINIKVISNVSIFISLKEH